MTGRSTRWNPLARYHKPCVRRKVAWKVDIRPNTHTQPTRHTGTHVAVPPPASGRLQLFRPAVIRAAPGRVRYMSAHSLPSRRNRRCRPDSKTRASRIHLYMSVYAVISVLHTRRLDTWARSYACTFRDRGRDTVTEMSPTLPHLRRYVRRAGFYFSHEKKKGREK